jgi:serine/threonine-protein kinase
MFDPNRPFDRYEIQTRLGRGGMGTVWKARDTVAEIDVALKIPNEDYWEDAGFLQRFKREAQLALRLHHSQICPIHHYGIVARDGDEIPFLAMRFIEG